MQRPICVFCHLVVPMLLQWQIEYLQVLLWQQRVCWTPDVSQWSPANVCHTDFVFKCHPETDLLECLVFFHQHIKKRQQQTRLLGLNCVIRICTLTFLVTNSSETTCEIFYWQQKSPQHKKLNVSESSLRQFGGNTVKQTAAGQSS